MNPASRMAQVERIEPPSKEHFYEHYVNANRPVVLAGAVKHWKASSCWSIDYLKSAIGDITVPVEVSSSGHFPADVQKIGMREMTVREYIDSNILSRPAGERHYLSQASIPDLFPTLMQDIDYPVYLDTTRPPRVNLWFGAAGTQTQLHYDDSHNLFAQLSGRKRFLLFSPGDSRRLYRYPLKHWYAHFSRINTATPDLQRYPRFAAAQPIECTLEPGDALFLPTFWWHQPACIDDSVSISMWWSPELKKCLRFRQFYWSVGNFALAVAGHLGQVIRGRGGPAAAS